MMEASVAKADHRDSILHRDSLQASFQGTWR
jgi:hypothetical protein